ncbi:C-type lectin lectoxin-Phi1-like [Branchiostoma lanceolatum]|uniref:C-type lectin lectoxin-Phi1-like n=1 Tax=Branchiostoma lanceolatum TaxID=7740 RepID=UPI0034514C9D
MRRDETVQQLVKLGASCPNGYQKHREVCYKVFHTPKPFLAAALTCRADGGTLAMPRDGGTNAFLTSLVKAAGRAKSVWFGLHDRRQEGVWEWMDGTELGTGFTAWAEGEPNNRYGKQDCAAYWRCRNFQWDDEKCCHKKKFTCQVTPSAVTVSRLDQKMSVRQFDHNTYMTTADLENVDGKLEQEIVTTEDLSEIFDKHDQSPYKGRVESTQLTTPEVPSVLENIEMRQDKTVQQLMKMGEEKKS